MANTTYQKAIYEMIDFKEEVHEKFKKLIDSTNDNMTFSENSDGSMACYIKYRGYDVALRITEKEVFEYALKNGKAASNAIEEIIKNKLFQELLKEKE